jgi:uncharacterized membrane protein
MAVAVPAAQPDRALRFGTRALAFMGVLHFAVPKPFDAIVPSWVPGKARTWTYVSGVWELGSAALLANPRTRKAGAYAAAATFVAVYPANIQMSIDNPPRTLYGKALAARLPLQLPMIFWALHQARKAGRTVV